MGKTMDQLKHQEMVEGLTDDLKIVYAVYDAILETSRSQNAFNTLVSVHYKGEYPNSKPFRYTTPLVRKIMAIEKEEL